RDGEGNGQGQIAGDAFDVVHGGHSKWVFQACLMKSSTALQPMPINSTVVTSVNPIPNTWANTAGSSWLGSNCSGSWIRTQPPEHRGAPPASTETVPSQVSA